MGFSTKPLVIDGRGHLLGRLASIVAKSLLQGQRVVVVRCEGEMLDKTLERKIFASVLFLPLFICFIKFSCFILPFYIKLSHFSGINISGSFYRNKLKYMDYLRKRCLVNPKRGPFHHRWATSSCLSYLRSVYLWLNNYLTKNDSSNAWYSTCPAFCSEPPAAFCTRRSAECCRTSWLADRTPWRDTAPTREFPLLTTRERDPSFLPPSGCSDSRWEETDFALLMASSITSVYWIAHCSGRSHVSSQIFFSQSLKRFSSFILSLTASSASWAVCLTRLDGSTNMSSPPWRRSARSRPPSTTRRSASTSSSRTRPRARSRPRLLSTRPSCKAAALTVFELFHLISRLTSWCRQNPFIVRTCSRRLYTKASK